MNIRYVLLLASMCGAAAVLAERLIQERLEASANERESLRIATEELQHRNNQLTALYNVFSEITESLSLSYVVSSTLRETKNLMQSDMTVLRVRRGDELVMVGALSGKGQQIGHLPSVKLGEGVTGRAAKRGRPVKLDMDAEQTMKPAMDTGYSPSRQTGEPPLESALVMPLILGARVVGTLSCWSRKKYAYDAEDERILEMMASQVATAVVAAEALETSERQAHHDALTDLPNRHQLNQDLTGELALLFESGRQAVVAMVDIDHFKAFNDDFGHRVGDVTLQKVASVMRHSVRDQDQV
jgi:predicted signal transduction protein with EAL and GGDEF domain